MAIESITGRTNNQAAIKTAAKTEIDGQKTAATEAAVKDDSVAITALTQNIKKAFESSSAVSSVDIDRVAAVKKALADGSYPINAERIAEKMIQFEKLMPQDNST
jgi:negative regulator of flagellin synthesis FlgM